MYYIFVSFVSITYIILFGLLILICDVLLQIWAWSRFRQIKPCGDLVQPPQARQREYPYGYRWVATSRTYDPNRAAHSLKSYRDVFDLMRPEEMLWQPYWQLDVVPRDIWRARVPLICNVVVEHHYPDRVMRQFGMTQSIPRSIDCSKSELAKLHGMDARKHDWRSTVSSFVEAWNQRFSAVQESAPFAGQMSYADAYMVWYRAITRRCIRSPQHRTGDGYRSAGSVIRLSYV